MPYVVPRPSHTWEIRETVTTRKGPRARTLATFRTLTPEVIEHARRRASRSIDDREIERAARRAGAPVATNIASDAAATMLRDLARGGAPAPGLRRLLLDALGAEEQVTDAERGAAAWLGVSTAERGEALRDLLLLADRLPKPRPRHRLRFPRVQSARQ